ncbi:hypothetical protein ACFL9U_01390 [Thermodesulfobacteriota bacterium]
MDQNIIGFGCFGKPEVFSKVLAKIMASHVLVKESDFYPSEKKCCIIGDDGGLFSEPIQGFLRIPEGKTSDLTPQRDTTKITGFFLAVDKQRLKLSVFTRESNQWQKRYTFGLAAHTNN